MLGHEGESLGTEAPPRGRRFEWHRRHTVGAIVLALVLAIVVASSISIPYYAITPGTAQSVEKLIGVPSHDAHSHRGEFLLVDVELVPLRAIEWPWYALNSDDQIVSANALLGPETANQYETEGELDMHDAQQAATVVALRTLGYHVSANSDGALIYATLPDSPASEDLAVGDVVSQVDGVPVTTAAGLGESIRQRPPGAAVKMTVLSYPSRHAKTVRVRLSAWRVKGKGKRATLVCPPWGTGLSEPLYHFSPATGKRVKEAPCIGALDVETYYRVPHLPLRVDLASEGIIGPSAGLAFTLGLIQRLDPYDLAGGHKIAATGTMSVSGQIGAVGGVAQKTVAVRNAGAAVFFVPRSEYKAAHSHSGDGLRIYPVTTIAQVISILERDYGGRLPARHSARVAASSIARVARRPSHRLGQ